MTDLEFTRTDDGTHIAYRVLDADPRCDDAHDLVFLTGGLIPIQLVDEEPGYARLIDGLRGLGRLIIFDRRGVGLSDPIADWERPVLDQWADDLAAVVEAADAHNVVIVATDGFGIGSRYVARHPERIAQLVLYDPIVAPDDELKAFSVYWYDRVEANIRGERDILDVMAPSRAHDPAFREWYERAGRMGASPASAQRIWQSVNTSEPSSHLLNQVAVPTLLLHRRGNQSAPKGNIEYVLDAIPGATLVEVDGDDVFAFAGDVDALVAEIAEFVVGERRLPPPERLLAAVLFSDLVGSTERAASLGDAQWKAVLDRHDKAVRGAVGRCGGTVVKTTGDGVLAMFPSATGALEAAQRLPSHLVEDDLLVRVGIHVGDVDRRGDDVSGLAVNIAARVMAHAADGTLAVTAPVVASVAGQAVAFESMGSHQLKGIPGEWELFRVV